MRWNYHKWPLEGDTCAFWKRSGLVFTWLSKIIKWNSRCSWKEMSSSHILRAFQPFQLRDPACPAVAWRICRLCCRRTGCPAGTSPPVSDDQTLLGDRETEPPMELSPLWFFPPSPQVLPPLLPSSRVNTHTMIVTWWNTHNFHGHPSPHFWDIYIILTKQNKFLIFWKTKTRWEFCLYERVITTNRI